LLGIEAIKFASGNVEGGDICFRVPCTQKAWALRVALGLNPLKFVVRVGLGTGSNHSHEKTALIVRLGSRRFWPRQAIGRDAICSKVVLGDVLNKTGSAHVNHDGNYDCPVLRRRRRNLHMFQPPRAD
jgi:hypothetical protein